MAKEKRNNLRANKVSDSMREDARQCLAKLRENIQTKITDTLNGFSGPTAKSMHQLVTAQPSRAEVFTWQRSWTNTSSEDVADRKTCYYKGRMFSVKTPDIAENFEPADEARVESKFQISFIYLFNMIFIIAGNIGFIYFAYTCWHKYQLHKWVARLISSF